MSLANTFSKPVSTPKHYNPALAVPVTVTKRDLQFLGWIQEFFKSSLLLYITCCLFIDFYANMFKGSEAPLSYTAMYGSSHTVVSGKSNTDNQHQPGNLSASFNVDINCR